MKLIPLTNGMSAKVDDQDYPLLSQWKWHAKKSGGGNWYAARSGKENGKRTTIRMHNVILGCKGIDHENGDGLDNQRRNLRHSTSAENNKNKRTQRTNKWRSRYKGVYYFRRKDFRVVKPWVARIYTDGQARLLGYYTTEKEAAHAYDLAATKYHGAFARLNFPVSRIRSLTPKQHDE